MVPPYVIVLLCALLQTSLNLFETPIPPSPTNLESFRGPIAFYALLLDP